MTLGTKLAIYRRLAGLTQQQLGDRLNLSPQAISKWEKDLTEPDLATLRTLAELYKVSIDELLNLNSGFPDPASLTEDTEEDTEEKESESTPVIGFCKHCGVTVNQENVAETDPVVICKKCKTAEEEAKKKATADAKRREKEDERRQERKRSENRHKLKVRLGWSFAVAGIVAAVFLGLCISAMVSEFNAVLLPVAIIGTYVVFAFVSCLFFDCIVQEVVVDWFDKSIHWPGLIFTFDVDGCLWMIGMKLLFFFLGLLFGIVTGAIGIMLGLICAPFVFPFTMQKVHQIMQSGGDPEEVL